jgi:hypothetical protein
VLEEAWRPYLLELLAGCDSRRLRKGMLATMRAGRAVAAASVEPYLDAVATVAAPMTTMDPDPCIRFPGLLTAIYEGHGFGMTEPSRVARGLVERTPAEGLEATNVTTMAAWFLIYESVTSLMGYFRVAGLFGREPIASSVQVAKMHAVPSADLLHEYLYRPGPEGSPTWTETATFGTLWIREHMWEGPEPEAWLK